MHPTHLKLLKTFHPSRIIIAMLIGVAVVLLIFMRDFKPGTFDTLNFSFFSFLFILLALLCMAARDIGYMIRIRVLSDNQLSWWQSFRIVMLWEFTSAITPSAIGGTSIAILFVTKEGISVGRSTSIVLATSFLDEMYFILLFPLLLIFVLPSDLFSTPNTTGNGINWTNEFFWFAIIGYSLKLAYVILVIYGMFFKPRAFKWLLLKVFKLPFLRRWRVGAAKAGDDMITSSLELKRKPFTFWIKSFMATFMSWTSRYLVINMLFLAFFVVNDHFLLYARQLVMWIMMLVSPTPGGSGFAEYIFSRYLAEFMPSSAVSIGALAVALAFLWRLITYYPYLIIGGFIIPGWIRSKFMHEKNN